jgi:hypothetical protein
MLRLQERILGELAGECVMSQGLHAEAAE